MADEHQPDPFDVCVVGSTNLDLVARASVLPGPGETVLGREYAEHPGGKGLNQAVAAARSGAATVFVSAVGDDDAGARLLGVMRTEGIDTSHVAQRSGVPTGRALIGVGDAGENSIVVVPGANATVTLDALPAAAVVLAQLEVPVDTVARAFELARAAGATTVLNPAPARRLPASLLALCDVVVPNEHEVELLGGVDALFELGARAIVVTEGSRGATLHEPGRTVHIPPVPVDPVDTTGAGDTFCGSLCARLAAGDDLVAALGRAAAAAALSTTRAGAVPSIPTSAEVTAFVAVGTSTAESEAGPHAVPGLPTGVHVGVPRDGPLESTHALRPSSVSWTHIALPSTDIEASIRWYEEFTPLRLLDQREDADGFGAWLGDPATGDKPFILVLVSFFKDQDRGPQPIMAPFAHIGIEMPTKEEVDEVAARGRAAGCLAWPPTLMPAPIGYICALTDPDGNMVEFSFDQGVYEKAREVWGV